jgi:ATP-dependent RNA helicase DDX42
MDDEVDPLDAFMAGIEAQVASEKGNTRISKIERCSFEEEAKDAKISIKPSSATPKATEQVYEEDIEEWNRLNKNQEMEELPPIDHSKVHYESFRKAFYRPSIAMTSSEIHLLRKELDIRVELRPGDADIAPIRSFMHAGFSRKLLALLMKHGLEAPTPIQSQAFPLALSGKDIIGIAQTGSGKTLAFVLPMMVHIMDQRLLEKDEGPIAIVLSPTRELAHQIYVEAKKFSMDANCAAIYGGAGNKWEQIQALKKGAEVVVATPGRLMEHLRKRVIKNLARVTFVVLDEADRMFEMGFEPQLRSILGQVRSCMQ